MSRLEGRARTTLVELMSMRATLLQLSDDERTTVSAWAIKTAFMIASAQQSITDLPWHLFRQLAEEPERVPEECLVLAAQLQFLPKGFLYACPTDILPRSDRPVQVRVGFSIHQLHFVVVIPAVSGRQSREDFGSSHSDMAFGSRNPRSLCEFSDANVPQGAHQLSGGAGGQCRCCIS
jgi:hypothetical protein